MAEIDDAVANFAPLPPRVMPALVRAKDWSKTPLGPQDSWSPSLRLAVDIVLSSGFPMALRWGPEFVLIYNDGYRPILGDKHPWALGRPAREAWAEVWPQIEPFHQRILAGDSEAVFARDTLLPIQRHGEQWEDARFTLSYSPTPDPTAPTGVGGVFVTALETTERVETDRRNSLERQRWEQRFNQMPGFVAILTGPTHVYDYVNEAYIAVAGGRDLIGRSVREAFPELEGQGFYELLDGAYATGERYVAHGLPVRLAGEGEDRFIDLLYEPIRDDLGAVTGVFVGGYDATEIHRAAAALRQLNADLERLVLERTQARGMTWRVSPDLMGALNAEGYFETSNPAWQTLLGWSEAEVASMSIWELLHPDDLERTRAGFALTQIGQPAIRFPNRYRTKAGDYRWISWVGAPEDGMVYCSGRDITEEVTAQEQLEVAQEALRQSQKMEAIGQLTGGIAHDFNNMLAIVIGSLDIAGRRLQRGDATVGLYLDNAREGAGRAAALTQRLLAFSRQSPLAPTVASVNTLVAGMSKLLRGTLGERIEIETVLAGGIWPAHVDVNQLESAIINLAVNGRDAMPDGGKLTIETANAHLDDCYASSELGLPAGQYVMIAVTDAGAGIPPDVLGKVFDPFFTTKPVGHGTGLGLSMVYGFAKQSGGHVRVYSEVGQGTSVKIYLPRHAGPPDQGTMPLRPIQLPTAAAEAEVVLVVEDEARVREMSAEALRELGYVVHTAASGEEALEVFDRVGRIDILFTDIVMPGMTGRQLADALRERVPDLRVLYTTGYTRNAVVHNGVLDPGVAFLPKPFSVGDLALKLRSMLDS